MLCEKHEDREGWLTVDIPSLNIKRYLCMECREQISMTPFKGKREAWETHYRIQDELSTDGRLVYPEMQGLMRNTRDYNRHD